MNHSDDAFASGPIDFDILRARIEGDVPRPGLILVISANSTDGSDVAARNLALSFANIDYQTLLLDASLGSSALRKSAHSTRLEDATRILNAMSTPTCVEILLDKVAQQVTSKAALTAALASLRAKFAYLVIHADNSHATSFTTLAIDLADAIFVTVRAGRRETSNDRRLSAALTRAGRRFLGVLSMSPDLLSSAMRKQAVPSIKADSYTGEAEKPVRASR